MSNRSINVLASMIVICTAWFCSQAFPVDDHVQCSISPREPSGPGDANQFAVADDDSDGASDDFGLLLGTSIWLPSGAAFLFPLGGRTALAPEARPLRVLLNQPQSQFFV
jgi:hypothetical protein